MNKNEVLKRYPRLCAHLMCQSLGYFSASVAAAALLSYIEKKPFWCEWYCSMAGYNDEKILKAGETVIQNAFKFRRTHRGYMASYEQARELVQRELKGLQSNPFGGWF